MKPFNLLAIVGPTATGKTQLAAKLAATLSGEIISADSRQVYRKMDLGTGKDLADYVVDGVRIPVHLIDIADAGYQYNVYEYQRDFLNVFNYLQKRRVFPVLCGGSGLYLEAVMNNYRLIQVPVNESLRVSLAGKTLQELTEILRGYKSKLHNITDIVNEKRAVRAIEIEQFYTEHQEVEIQMPHIHSLVAGIRFERNVLRKRITQRLHQRLDEGMVEEVRNLLASGLTPDNLIYYGLEYKFITQYISGEIDYDVMVTKLNTAIHQYSKRQMTWFRRMERQGTVIHWIDGAMSDDRKVEMVLKLLDG
jgi:tRNA dimethylallyltransferase